MPLSPKSIPITSDLFEFYTDHLKNQLYYKTWQIDLGDPQGWPNQGNVDLSSTQLSTIL